MGSVPNCDSNGNRKKWVSWQQIKISDCSDTNFLLLYTIHREFLDQFPILKLDVYILQGAVTIEHSAKALILHAC